MSHYNVYIRIPVCGGVVCVSCVGVGGGVEVGRTSDVELPSGEPVEDKTYKHNLDSLLVCALTYSPITAVINGTYWRLLATDCAVLINLRELVL